MNWVTTNIRSPEDLYMELKLEAAKRRKSVAAIARERLAGEKNKAGTGKKNIWKRLDKLSKELSKQNPGVSLSQKLIEMRYEQ